MDILKNDQLLMNPKNDKALEILTTMSMDKNERAAYLSREMALHDQATFIEEGREEGRKEGIKEGKIEAKIETAKNLLSMGIEIGRASCRERV